MKRLDILLGHRGYRVKKPVGCSRARSLSSPAEGPDIALSGGPGIGEGMSTCPCGSHASFQTCCGPFLSGTALPATAEALMRSRYVAYTMGNLDYLERTAAGEARLKFDRAEMAQSLPGTEWLGLEIVATEQGAASDETGFVTFRARFRQQGELYSQSERSEFMRVGGAWRYCRGEVDFKARPLALRVPGRNDPCICGSGRKYKKCCGA